MYKKYIRIKETRKDAGYTQEDMSKKLNVSLSGYKKWESGSRSFPLEELVTFSDILNVSVDYLLDRTNCRDVNNKK